jgi:transposase
VSSAGHAATSDLEGRIAVLETTLAAERCALAAERAAAAAVTAERDRLREAYQALQLEVELMRRRMFVAKAERIDTAQLELEFAGKLAALDQLAGELGSQAGEPPPPTVPPPGASGGGKTKPKGRRNLRTAAIPEERIELADPAREGQAEPIGFEESCRLVWRRGGPVRLVLARVKYREERIETEPTALQEEPLADTTIITAPMPPELLPRSLATPSLVAHIATDKLCDGLPLHRQEDRFARLGVRLDRGTMSRWLEDVGMITGSSVVAAMREEALRTAFCLSTDATGVLVQPIPDGNKQRRSCRRGHYFVQIADRDHIFFEYTARETSATVGELFRGFSGYVQADAKSVYDILFRPPNERPPPEDGREPDLAERYEVGCWSHGRRRLWEAAIAKDPIAREGLARIGRMFALERSWRGRPHSEIKSLRDRHLRPHISAFFAWAIAEYDLVKDRRGLLRSALGYVVRQREALTRFLDDGRLRMDNNESERQLRRIAVGRKAWLFVGSDDHAQAAGNLLSLIASARLHGLDPEAYLRDLFRVLMHWPRDRYIELAPRYWAGTRTRLDPAQLQAELGPLTIPSPLPAEEQPAAR